MIGVALDDKIVRRHIFHGRNIGIGEPPGESRYKQHKKRDQEHNDHNEAIARFGMPHLP
ncbi:hypothetical protein D3C71_2184610 [compost metagenome]